MNEKITLSGVPETMLQTVYARAKESRTRGAIHDAKAEELIDKLDYDFSLADKDAAMHSGVIARTIVLDALTQTYLEKHHGAVVVNIACGLDTRCCRVSGYSHWYNLDLPDTIAVRERIMPESGSVSQIAMSAMDDWGSLITEAGAPALVIIEGLTMYLSQADVQRIFAVIAARFESVTVFVELSAVSEQLRRRTQRSFLGKVARPLFRQSSSSPCALRMGMIQYHSLSCMFTLMPLTSTPPSAGMRMYFRPFITRVSIR